jgi:membrane-associated phospholipid phosphatase
MVMAHYYWTKLLFFIVNLGNLRIAVPIAAILFIWLCTHGRWRTGLWCAVAVTGCMATMFLIKLGFFTGHLRLPELGLGNPSGHGAMAAVVYGPLAWVVGREMPGWPRRLLLLLGGLGVAAVAVSLYLLSVHTLPDILAGLAVGCACAAVFMCFSGRDEADLGARPVHLMLVIAIAALSLQGLFFMPRLAVTDLLLHWPHFAVPA